MNGNQGMREMFRDDDYESERNYKRTKTNQVSKYWGFATTVPDLHKSI